MTTVYDVQRALNARGAGLAVDGLAGPATCAAILRQLVPAPGAEPPASTPRQVVPADWMPWAKMQRIIVHWTAGQHAASAIDREHYHILIEGDGKPVRGKPSIALNEAPVRPGYAAHTLNCNSGSVGVALCGMAGATEAPFDAGRQPITAAQWEVLPSVLADLCRRYGIPVTPATVLTHAEVQATLGIPQRGKWDIARLPFVRSLDSAAKVGDAMREATAIRL